MKKLLLFIALIISGLGLNAQNQSTITIEIGADKNHIADNYYLPVSDYAKYSVSQQIYTEEDFGGNLGLIKSVAFKLSNDGKATNRTYEIYMKHAENLDSQVAISAEDKVFDGEVALSNIKNTWITIPFDKAFDYAGGNVMICVYDKTGVSAVYPEYHTFYAYATDSHRARFFQSTYPIDLSNVKLSNCPTPYINLVRFEMTVKSIVKVEPEAVDLGEVTLGGYWSESKPFELNVKVSNTTITDLKVDNDFFVLPALEDIDFSAAPVVIEVSYDKNAAVDGFVSGNITISYEDIEVVIPVTANAYTPGEADVWELAKEIKFENNTYKDTPAFDKLHDNYLLPRETANAVTPDAVYSFELKKESIICAKVEGVNAKMAIYKESFNGKGGPSNDNNYKGNVFIDSEFFFDFNEEVLNGWTVKNAYNNANNWQMLKSAGVDGTNCIVSYSYKTYPDRFFEADNFIMTERTYNITENSKLSFDAMCDALNEGDIIDHVKVKVSKDGESMTLIEEITPTSATYSNNVIDLGAKFAELGLEYGDYHIVLHHQETLKFYVCVDNIRLSNSANVMNVARSVATIDTDEIYGAEYPVGKYYVVAAAEGQFNIELTLLNEEDLPATPANLVATTIDEFSIKLEWDAVEKATSYNIYRNDEFVANVVGTTFLDENLESDVDYCYVVKAYNDILESVASEKACAKTKKFVLTPPTEIKAVATSTTTIVLTWSKVEKVGGYAIYSGYDYIRVSDTTYTIENLVPNTEYCYMVSSVYKDRESFATSDIACARTFDLPITTPANLVAEATSTSSISLTWNAVENALSYNIYNGVNKVANVTTNSYEVNNLNYYTDYCFTVTAVRNETETEKSESACAKTFDLPITMPVNLTATPINTSSIILTWNVVENALSYNVYQDNSLIANVASNMYSANDLESYTEYCFTVTAVRNETESDKSEEVCAKTMDLSITKPEEVVATPTSTSSIIITWEMVENALSYNIYNGVNKIANVTTNSYEVNNLNYYTDYCFTVTAVRNETETENSEPSCAKTFDLPITTPNNLVAEATSTSSILLTWNAVENALSYNIYNGVNKVANVTTTSYVVDNLNYYTDYCFTVSAVRNETETDKSEEACSKTFDLSITTPENLIAEALSFSSISLTWNAVENALSYNVYNGGIMIANVTGNSYIVNDLNYDTDYCYTVTAVRNETETDKSEEACAKMLLPITTPENVIAEATGVSTISLTWNAVENALSYNVYSGENKIANVIENTYIVNELNYYTDYCFTVTAVRNETETEKSESACAKTFDLPITMPVNLTATPINTSSIILTWNVVENALSYNVYQDNSLIANVASNMYSANDLESYTEYCFTVTAVRNETETDKSEETCSKTIDLPITMPVNLTATPINTSSIILTWNVVENALSYNVYQDNSLIANVASNMYSANDLESYTEYCFTVTAVRNETESDKSEEVCAKTMDLSITKPEDVVATPTSTSSIILTWEMVENALSYNLYRDNELVKNLKNTNYTDTGLEYDTEYCYVVTAVRNETESEKSEKVCVKTLGEGVNEISSDVNVYPIPVTDKLFIDTETYIEEISIYTLSGVMIYKEVDFNNKSVDVSEYNSGVYVIKIKSNDKVVMKRFIKN